MVKDEASILTMELASEEEIEHDEYTSKSELSKTSLEDMNSDKSYISKKKKAENDIYIIELASEEECVHDQYTSQSEVIDGSSVHIVNDKSGIRQVKTKEIIKCHKPKTQAWAAEDIWDKINREYQQLGDRLKAATTKFNHILTQGGDNLFGCYGFFILLFVILYSCTITLWPQHNVVTMPEYWYEPLGQLIVGWVFIDVVCLMLSCSILLEAEVIRSWKTFARMFLTQSIALVISHVSIYLIWVYVLGYCPPIPFIGKIVGIISYVSKYVALWFSFPAELRLQNLT